MFDLPQQPACYTDFDTYSRILKSRSHPLDALIARSTNDRILIEHALRLGRDRAHTVCSGDIALQGIDSDADRADTALAIETLSLDPWT